MKILYKGKSRTYIGECECETVVMANKSEIDFFPPPASVPGSVRCPTCGSSFFVYKDGTEPAKDIRTKYQNKQKEDNRHSASIFLDGLEETQEEREIKIKFDQLKEILEWYADKDNYWESTRSLEYISNGHREEHFNCTDCDPDDAVRGLLLLEELKSLTD